MTGSAIEKDSTSKQNYFSEWSHLSVPYIICVAQYGVSQILYGTDKSVPYDDGDRYHDYFIKTILLIELYSSVTIR